MTFGRRLSWKCWTRLGINIVAPGTSMALIHDAEKPGLSVPSLMPHVFHSMWP